MIAIEILESPDNNVKTSFRFFKNDLYLGKKSGDLLIDDTALLPSHLMIEILENDLLVHPQKGVGHYLINGKRATTIRKIKTSDTIGFGGTTLKILEFAPTPDRSKKSVLNEKLAHLIDSSSERLITIEKLSEMMK